MGVSPTNFSWVIENKIAASAFPFDEAGVSFFIEQGISAIINLSGKSSNGTTINKEKIKEYMIDIPDFGIPTKAQIEDIWEIVDGYISNNESVVIHCIAGCGRTGTVLASLIFHLGIKSTMEEAISYVRKLRPCSIETEEQKNFLLNTF